MLPRPRLDLSGTPGHRPIGLSPGSWQTSLGSMSRYSAQISICILGHETMVFALCLVMFLRPWMDWHLHIYVNCWLRTSLRALSDPWIIIFWSRRSVDWSILAKDLLLQLPQCCGMTYLYTSNNPHRWTFLSLVLRHVCSNLLISYDCVNVCMFISC